MEKIKNWVKKETILVVSWGLAIISCCFIFPDQKYVEYIDFNTLGILFCLMAIMEGFQALGIFRHTGELLLKKVKNTRQLEAILIFLCYISSMFITNDVALITFVPFTLEILHMIQQENRILPVVVMQTIAANLGSMLTPIGNPQNLYLFSKFNISIQNFIFTILPYAILSFVLIALFVFFQKPYPISTSFLKQEKLGKNKKLFSIYCILFILSLATVVHFIPTIALFVVVLTTIVIADQKILKKVDYSLLFTFIGFFIFVGNIGRISIIHHFLETVLQGNEVLVSVGISQFISNVPAALLLAGFTNSWNLLLIGTNIGGLGTLIASMASLISFKFICKDSPQKKNTYLGYFTIFNLVFLTASLILYFLMG